MALNIKPFEGPRAPDWTDPPMEMAPGPAPQSHDQESGLENSDAHLLLLDPNLQSGERFKLKKLDII